jgi:hypothetical protein
MSQDYAKPERAAFLRGKRLRYEIAGTAIFAAIWFAIGFLAARMI